MRRISSSSLLRYSTPALACWLLAGCATPASPPAPRTGREAAARAATVGCGARSPAFPVPEFRGGVRLWPPSFRPARPGQQIPAPRDSSDYTSNTFPSAASGHELFWAIDVAEDHAFVMYNVGISAWDLSGTNAEIPRQVAVRDGILGHWFHHDGPGEADGFLTDIAAMPDPANSGRALIAVSGLSPIGISIWRFDRASRQLTQAYQNTTVEAHDVELLAFGGKLYAFFATGPGAYVVDVTQTNGLPGGCLENGASSHCPGGILLGRVGTAAGSRYLGATLRGGKVYLAGSIGGLAPTSPLPEIWELDPAHPMTAARRFRGTVRDTHSPVFFVKDGKYYLAVVEAKRIKIYPAEDCLDASGCASLPTPVFDHPLRSQNWTYNFLSYSQSLGTPFLYYGFEGIFPRGAAYERLFDLSNLGSASPLAEITAGGGTYTDGCSTPNTEIGYWSDYYENNENGFRNYSPRKGKFNGRYFYKVNTGTFDVHVREGAVTAPTITTMAGTPPPYYFGDPIPFAATAQACAGPETWSWGSAPPASAGLGGAASAATLTWNLCAANRCPDQQAEVWARKAACAAAPNLVEHKARIQLADPRPQIQAIAVAPPSPTPNTYPLCSLLSFGADVSGKPPFVHQWRVRNGAGATVATGGGPTFGWNTAGVNLSSALFADGFESGDTSAWTMAREAAARTAERGLIEEVTGAGSASFAVGLTVTAAGATPATASRNITLTALGPLSFSPPPVAVTSLGAATYRLRANTQNATRWRWEFEDPGGGAAAGCRFYPRCRIIDFGADDNEVTVTWAAPNMDGPYRVRVEAGNCLAVAPIAAEATVQVTGLPGAAPPAVSTFSVTMTPHCSLNLDVLECGRGMPINFRVTHTGMATHYDFDWEGDGTFEQRLPVGSGAFSHTYGSAGLRSPKVRARNGSGAPSAPLGLPWGLQILGPP
jgi:hypothetical protein